MRCDVSAVWDAQVVGRVKLPLTKRFQSCQRTIKVSEDVPGRAVLSRATFDGRVPRICQEKSHSRPILPGEQLIREEHDEWLNECQRSMSLKTRSGKKRWKKCVMENTRIIPSLQYTEAKLGPSPYLFRFFDNEDYETRQVPRHVNNHK